MWSFPYLNRPGRGQLFTTQPAMVVSWHCVSVYVCVCMLVCFAFAKLRTFLCGTSHCFSPELRNAARVEHICLEPQQDPARNQRRLLFSVPAQASSTAHRLLQIHSSIRMPQKSTRSKNDATAGLTVGWLWCVKRGEFYSNVVGFLLVWFCFSFSYSQAIWIPQPHTYCILCKGSDDYEEAKRELLQHPDGFVGPLCCSYLMYHIKGGC